MASQLPTTMKAITIHGNKASISTKPLPALRPTYVLVKVHSIALNPTDWKHIAGSSAAENSTSGCDFSGTIIQIGDQVTKDLKVGERVAGTTHGANFSNVEDGCFAEYAVAKGDLLVRIGEEVGWEKGATFPLGVSTVGQGLFQKGLGLKVPGEGSGEGEMVLIYGGSTATGSLAIQYAKLAGYKVLTTCSPHNHDFVKSLGADAVYDYRDPECGKKINKDTNDSLKLVWDTVSLASSAAICEEAISTTAKDAKYAAILPVKLPNRTDVAQTWTIMYTIFNEPFTKWGRSTPASQEDFDFAKKFFSITENLLKEGKLKTHPEKVGQEGLKGALQGMKDMQAEKVSGQKLVYRVAETPEGAVGVEVEF